RLCRIRGDFLGEPRPFHRQRPPPSTQPEPSCGCAALAPIRTTSLTSFPVRYSPAQASDSSCQACPLSPAAPCLHIGGAPARRLSTRLDSSAWYSAPLS